MRYKKSVGQFGWAQTILLCHSPLYLICHQKFSHSTLQLRDKFHISLDSHLAVKPHYCLALAIVSPHPFLVHFVLHFPLLGWLFTGGRCRSSLPDRILWRTFTQYSHVLTSQPGFVLHCDSVCLCAHSSFGQFGRTYQLLFRHVPQMLGKCPMSDCNFIYWFGATISTELYLYMSVVGPNIPVASADRFHCFKFPVATLVT